MHSQKAETTPTKVEQPHDLKAESKKQPHSTLSPRAKKKLFDEIKKKDKKVLKKAFKNAALNMLTFPKSISHKLSNLQLVCKEHEDTASTFNILKSAIKDYVKNALFEEIYNYLQQPFKEEEWNSALLVFLCNYLEIKIQEEPVVEVAIKHAKIYWRIRTSTDILYDRQLEKGKAFDYKKHATWLMSWELFRVFKDSGKRSSSVAVTKQLFSAQFPREEKIADAVWDQLKEKGVLNTRNRLSHGWRALSNNYVRLDKPSKWTYAKILKAIYAVANNPGNKETINTDLDASIFRPEKGLKNWEGTGRVTISKGKTTNNAMRLWDVGPFSYANGHRGKVKTALGDKFNFDHIPSSAILRDEFSKTPTHAQWTKYHDQIEEKEQNLTDIQESIDATITKGHTNDESKTTTREQAKLKTKEKVADLAKEKKEIKEQIKKLKAKQAKLLYEDENTWFTMTIPEKLHKQGETYLQNTKEQKSSVLPHFLKEMTAYLDILEKRGSEFFDNPDEEYIKALGAFRFFYKICMSPPPNVDGQFKIGSISGTLFHDLKIKENIDKFFTERMIRYLAKREGSDNTSGKNQAFLNPRVLFK